MTQANSLIPAGAPEADALKSETTPIIDAAKDIVIDSDAMFAVAGDELRTIATKRKALEERRLAITRPMDAAKRSVMDLFATPLTLLNDAERDLRNRMGAYTTKRQNEEREAARQREAAAQRERDRLREEARAAEAQGDTATATVLATTAETVTAAVPDVAASTPKAAGISTSKRWSAEIEDKRAFIEHALKDEQYFDMILIDMKPLNQMAVAMKDKMKVPGIKSVSTNSMTVR